MDRIKIEDNSGDKEFFTIIPNYIANHSTSDDQSLYLQMKKHAGENGKCFATEKTLMRKMGVGKKAFDKSLNYLIKKGWITFVGLTSGKTRPIRTYQVNNIWKMNNEHYKKISAESNVSFNKISAESKKDKSQKQHKISAESNVEEEPCIIRTNNKKAIQRIADDINPLIDLFKDVNPSYERLFSNKTQRASLERLVKKFGYEKVERMIKFLPEIFGKPYAPQITTPYVLEQKLGDLVSYIQKRSEEKIPLLDLTKKNV
jgi:hypothetical protein